MECEFGSSGASEIAILTPLETFLSVCYHLESVSAGGLILQGTIFFCIGTRWLKPRILLLPKNSAQFALLPCQGWNGLRKKNGLKKKKLNM